MNSNTAHFFLTGGSLNMVKSFNLVTKEDFVITTNFGILNKYIAKRSNAYFVNNSYRSIYRKNAQMSLKLAEGNVDKDCIFYVKKKYINYAKSININRKVRPIPIYLTWLGKLIQEKKFHSTTHYCGFHILNLLNYKTIYLWGADYILDKPIISHFYNFNIEYRDQTDIISYNSYNYIKQKFNNIRIIHVCPEGSKSAIFETINA